ncbi:KR domain [Seminavis robusta]|uniref:KR domain n=1 Tax=Seminavis robusta TaxID=568900 RepID=A0A9N8D499_9STRA|nr:KR domain [Seminavis robusta]|eukprot:Sro1_g001050.1 KR domain (252) ;mRNA; f:313933-314688
MLAHWNPTGIALVSLWLLIITTSTAFSSLDDGRPVAIITGGTRGIGSGIASALADDGFDLLLTYNSNVQAAQDFVKTLQDKHPSIHCELVGGDLSKEETRHAIFDCFDTKFDGNSHHLQVVVHNAGQYLGVTSTNEAGLDAQSTSFGDNSILDENGIPNLQAMKFYQRLYGDAWIDLCERGIARMNSANGGSLIGISSPSVNSMYRPDPTYSLPGSGKCIMEYSNRILALKGAAMNINCNVIIPGVTLTDS